MAITNGRPFSSLPNAKHPAVGTGCGVDGLWVAEFAWGVALADEAFAAALVWDWVGHAVNSGAGWSVEFVAVVPIAGGF